MTADFLAALARHQRLLNDPDLPTLTPAEALDWLRDQSAPLSPGDRESIAAALDQPGLRARGRPLEHRLQERQARAALFFLMLVQGGHQGKAAGGRVAELLGIGESTVRHWVKAEKARLGDQAWKALARDAATLLEGYRSLEAAGEADGRPLRELPLIRRLLGGH